MFSPRWVLFSIGFLYCARVYTQDILEYECDADKVIAITNPNASFYIWAQVNASSKICPSNLTGDKIFVSDCFNESLTMIISNVDGMPTIVTSVIKSYRLSCLVIPEEGIVRKVVDDTHIINYVSTSLQPTIIPTVVLNSSLVDLDSGFAKTAAVIGETFLWFIIGPEQYRIVPEECTVYSGEMADTTVYSLDSHINGCTNDDALVSDFRYYNESSHVVVADVHAFRFPNSNQIHFSCNVRGCPLNSTSLGCSINCTNRRKKREDSLISIDDLFPVKLPTTPGPLPQATPTPPSRLTPKRPTRSTSLMRRGKVHVSLTIIGEANIFIDELPIGASPGQSGAGVLMILVMPTLTFYLFH